MRLAGSASVGRFQCNKKRPPTARQRRIEGLTTRRTDLPMAGTHPMYLCPQWGSNLLDGRERTNG
jgi:hypothetical protein